MKVVWDAKARKSRNQVAEYIHRHFGAKRKDMFLLEVRETTKMLKTHPNLGPIDPLFNDRPKTYRSVIINGLSKMVYFIEDDTIYIAAFWDTRCEPKQQARQVK